MGLIMNYSTGYGISVNNGYIRIEEVSGTKEQINARTRYYWTKEKADAGCEWFKEELFSFVPSIADEAPNYHKQGYEYIKTLPQFNGAVDA